MTTYDSKIICQTPAAQGHTEMGVTQVIINPLPTQTFPTTNSSKLNTVWTLQPPSWKAATQKRVLLLMLLMCVSAVGVARPGGDMGGDRLLAGSPQLRKEASSSWSMMNSV